MPTIHLTKRTIEALDYAERGQLLYRDAKLPGFGLRVGAKSKVYFAEGQVDRRTRRVSIGRADVIAPDAARKHAMQLLAEMATGVEPVAERRRRRAERITVCQAFDAFFEARSGLASCTVDSYRRTRRVYLSDWADRPLRDITREMVLTRHRSVSERHGGVTANNVFRHFRSVYNFAAVRREDLPPNPVAILTQGRAWHREKRRRRLIAAHDLPRWWATVMRETPDARDILLFALLTGMRRSEVLALRWENVDLIGRVICVPKTKNGEPLELPLSDYLAELIAGRREIVGQTPWVFPGVGGRRGHIAEVKSFVRRVSEVSGVAFSMHDLRRTFVTVAESRDIPHYALKRLLNHRADSDVTGGYIIISPERLREPMERITRRILELADG